MLLQSTVLFTRGVDDAAQRPDIDEAVQHAMQGAVEDELKMKLSLHFACKDLKNVDIGSYTDSVVVTYIKKK